MNESTSKEKVLKKIRNALINNQDITTKNVDFVSTVYNKQQEVAEVEFATNLVASGGTFVYCANEHEAIESIVTLITQQNLKGVMCTNKYICESLANNNINTLSYETDFNNVLTGITTCEYLISRTGSIIVSSALGSGRRLMIFPETHIIIAKASQVVSEIKQALLGMKKRYHNKLPSQITLITGPSRSADIESTLVIGAHGPKKLFVLFIDDL